MRYFWISLLLCSLAICSFSFAEPPLNKKYSYKGFPYHGLSFKDRPASEFNNTVIKGSCFYQEWREGDRQVVKDIFPRGMRGVIFRSCNLDNIYVPPGNTIEGGTHKIIKVQNDWEDWILDGRLRPVEPMNKEQRLEAGISIDPNNIPKRKFTRNQRRQFKRQLRGLANE